MQAPATRQPPALANPVLADGLRWALAAVLVVQTFFTGLAPSVLVTLAWIAKAQRSGHLPLDLVPLVSSLIPWAVFLAAHLAQIAFLRRLAGFPYSNGQVALMALLPGYNIFGSVELFAAQGDAMERLGSRPGLAVELRTAAAMASGLAVALAVLAVRWLRPFIQGLVPSPDPGAPGLARNVIILSVALLLARLYVVARLQIATRDLTTALRAAPLPPTEWQASAPGLPGSRRSIATMGLALAVGAYAFVFSAPSSSTPSVPSAVFTRAPIARAPEPPPPPQPVPVPRAAPAPKGLPAGHLIGGRTIDWWRERLQGLAARDDDAARQLLAVTLERAALNGLRVTRQGRDVQVEASPELVSAANAEVPP